MTTTDQELDVLIQMIASSRFYAWLARPVRWAARAWTTSATRRLVGAVGREISALETVETLRLSGLVLVAAVLTDGLLRQFDPRPASAIRAWLWGALLLASVVMLTAAPQLAEAWRRRLNR